MHSQQPRPIALRAATEADIPALAALEAAHTQDAIGSTLRTENEIRIEWKSPTFDPQIDSRVAVDPHRNIVGWCEVYDVAPHTRLQSRLRVYPKDGATEVADALIQWAASRALQSLPKAPTGERVVLTQGAYHSQPQCKQLLERHGFTYTRTFRRMRIELTDCPDEPTWPDGITVRSMVPGVDDRAAVHAVRDAMKDHWGYVDTPFDEDLEEWQQWIHEDDDFDTDLWFLAMDGAEIAGFCQCYPIVGDDPRIGLVDDLGVRPPWRGRGIATALLRHAFGAFYSRGKPVIELGVDSQSPTGATRLYEKAGMEATWASHVYELELRSG